jgi:5-methyltetrahydrofolate--homocysteine methyltransferase
MTKVRIEEYYRRWHDHLTIMGGIPESVLLESTATDEEFEAYLDNLFSSVAPGDRLILGTADSTPPDAKFERLHRIQERVEKEGRLPLVAGGSNPVAESDLSRAAARVAPSPAPEGSLEVVRRDVIEGDSAALRTHTAAALTRGASARDILHKGMIPAMEIVAERFQAGEVFIPEVLLSARAMNDGLLLLEPHLASEAEEAGHRVLIGTVYGDMHDIGKNMVAIMLRGVGFEVRDIGVNVSVEDFVREVEQFEPHIIGISALLTTTMPEMKKIIEALSQTGVQRGARILVGGAPVNQKFADDIGADGYARDAGEAVHVARSLVSST